MGGDVGSWQLCRISCVFEFGTVPNHRRDQKLLFPVIANLNWHSLSCKSGQDVAQLFFLRFLCSERSCHRFLLFPRITLPCPIHQEIPLCIMFLLCIINTLEVGGCCCVSIWAHPGLCIFCLLSVVLSYMYHHPPVRFLGQAHLGNETLVVCPCEVTSSQPTSLLGVSACKSISGRLRWLETPPSNFGVCAGPRGSCAVTLYPLLGHAFWLSPSGSREAWAKLNVLSHHSSASLAANTSLNFEESSTCPGHCKCASTCALDWLLSGKGTFCPLWLHCYLFTSCFWIIVL
jgi:hypothetical protein